MNILVEIKNHYGTRFIYPLCDTGKLFLRFTGNKTLSNSDIETIKTLGYTIKIKEVTL
tara:strand:+ start:219 stop:392 length:174 start_codon:yes stop_codon:yes gene_type:complete